MPSHFWSTHLDRPRTFLPSFRYSICQWPYCWIPWPFWVQWNFPTDSPWRVWYWLDLWGHPTTCDCKGHGPFWPHEPPRIRQRTIHWKTLTRIFLHQRKHFLQPSRTSSWRLENTNQGRGRFWTLRPHHHVCFQVWGTPDIWTHSQQVILGKDDPGKPIKINCICMHSNEYGMPNHLGSWDAQTCCSPQPDLTRPIWRPKWPHVD
jgi:hypothetical protein